MRLRSQQPAGRLSSPSTDAPVKWQMENMTLQLQKINAFLLDLDGTLYLGSKLLPGTSRFLDTLSELGLRRLFLTNNSLRSTRQYLQKFRRMGFIVNEEEILTSGWATIHYILSETNYRKVYLLGSRGLRQEFTESGIDVVNHLLERDTQKSCPDAVVIGFDQEFTYEKLRIVSRLIREGVPYIATHADKVCPTESIPVPDAGAVIEYLAVATENKRPKIIGKPYPTMIRAALARTGTSPGETAMVGDRIATDVRMAKEGGLFSILVLSGDTSRKTLESADDVKPDLVLEHVGELTDCLLKCRWDCKREY